MKPASNKGFTIIVALLMLVLAGAALVVLAHASTSMVMETRTAACCARSDNLLASARAWARVHAAGPVDAKALPTDGLAGPGAKLTVTVAPDGQTLQIHAACPRGPRTFTRNVVERLPARPAEPAAKR